MARIDLADLPPELIERVGPHARLAFPSQGMTSDVAFAELNGDAIVIKRCAHPIYLDWLRREQAALRALAESGLPIPRFIAYAETESNGRTAGWLLMTRLAGTPFLSAAADAPPAQRVSMFRRLGELVRRLHATPVPLDLRGQGPWLSRQIDRARGNLPWCDGTAAGLAELEASRPAAVRETLIHGDLALDNVLVDGHGALSLIDWADGGLGDPRHDLALALQAKPELDRSADALASFFGAYGTAALDETTRDWFVRLYDFF
jgi:aminoglycoside 3'-phosphotransferase-2